MTKQPKGCPHFDAVFTPYKLKEKEKECDKCSYENSNFCPYYDEADGLPAYDLYDHEMADLRDRRDRTVFRVCDDGLCLDYGLSILGNEIEATDVEV